MPILRPPLKKFCHYMNNLIVIFVLVAFLANSVKGQLIDNSICNAFSDEPFFNTEIVKLNKLRSLHGTISTKKELSAIKKSGKSQHFKFDKKGNLTQQYTTFFRKNKKDTTFILYNYDNNGNLTTKRTNDVNGFYSYNYEFNQENDIIKKTYCRDHNKLNSRSSFILEKQYVIIKEGYSYKKNDSVVIKNVLNNNGLPYQQVKYIYNSLGYLISETKKLLINNKKTTTNYSYNSHGLLSAKKITNNQQKQNVKKTTYLYDELGNLIEINDFKNNKHITHKEILYDEKTYLLKALIIQDVETNFIKIIKFKASFY